MIEITIIICLILIGYMFTRLFFNNLNFLEIIGFTLFFAILIVPLISTNISLIFDVLINKMSLLIITLIVLTILIIYIYIKKIKLFKFPKIKNYEFVIILIIILIGFFSYFYYNNSIYYLSLTSYLEKGETNCFYMLTFALQPELKESLASQTPYDIVSTPGNSLFTAPGYSVLNYNTFRFMYVIFEILLFLFLVLLINFFIKKQYIAILAGLFAIYNPFNLFIEVFDRNLMALVISIILFYTIFKHQDKVIIHGLIFGVVSGLGLRFLPLVFIIPIFLVYFKGGKKPIDYFIFILVAFLVFGYNLPHLKYHGFNTIGETQSYVSLFILAFTKFLRTPFVPYPNLLVILFSILAYFGIFISSIVFLGIYRLIKKNKYYLLIFGLIFLLPLLTLAIQRDFLEVAKNRIIIMGFLSIYVFFAYGLLEIYSLAKKGSVELFKTIFVLFVIFMFIQVISSITFNEENAFYDRKLLYQKETIKYHILQKTAFFKINLLPDYGKLNNKINLQRKSNEQTAIIESIIRRQNVKEYLLNQGYNVDLHPIIKKNITKEYINIKINLDKLVTDIHNSVIIVNSSNEFFIDFSQKELLDIYYNEFQVSWQDKMLPLVVFPHMMETDYLDEIYLDLNSFISYGQDELGFERINAINYLFYPRAIGYAQNSAMLTIPSSNFNQNIFIRVPKTSKLIVRNWFINGASGQPFKVDSWKISFDKKNVDVKFYYNEPETYI